MDSYFLQLPLLTCASFFTGLPKVACVPFGVSCFTSRLFAALLPSVSVGSSLLDVSVDLGTSEFAITVNGDVSQANRVLQFQPPPTQSATRRIYIVVT